MYDPYGKHVGNFQHSYLKTKKFEEIQALYEKIKRLDEDFIAIGSAEDERMIKEMNEKGIDSSNNERVKCLVPAGRKGEDGLGKRKRDGGIHQSYAAGDYYGAGRPRRDVRGRSSTERWVGTGGDGHLVDIWRIELEERAQEELEEQEGINRREGSGIEIEEREKD
ncbi:hypothetical protein Tco_0618758 [Tanacetum coccineum]